jgi:cellulose synthase/poly-beta-1,6-N-acetylglucosamine synthase-like glycosyltransferase
MLRVLAQALQAGLLGLVAYNALTSLWGWRVPPPASPGARRRHFRVVVPAHDEEAVIGHLLADLAAQDYDPGLVSKWVIADRCRDRTAEVARRWAQVAERHEGPEGKGAALGWYLERHPLQPEEALMVIDADNRVPAGFLARMSDELDAGHQVLQAYLDVANPDESWVATASALSYWASNRMVQLARRNLGWSSDLGGTGMCLTPQAVAAAGGFGGSLAEDQELTARLVVQGIPAVWLHDLRIGDEKPTRPGVAVRQRARWKVGWRRVARRYLIPLLRAGVRRRSPSALDLAVRVVQPSRTWMALSSAFLAMLAPAFAGWLLPWPVWAGATLLQVVLPLPFLAREGVPARYLVRYPLLAVLAVLWLPVRVLSARAKAGWYHTPHGGSPLPSPPPKGEGTAPPP